MRVELQIKTLFNTTHKLIIVFATLFTTITATAQSTLIAELGSPVKYDGWVTSGATVSNLSDVQLTPAIQNQAGAIYYNQPYSIKSCGKFRVLFDYLMTGGTTFSENGITSTGDGIAFWFLENPPQGLVAGSNLGMPNTGATGNNKGLKVALDVYDNDSKANNPSVMAYWGGNFTEGDGKETSLSVPNLRSNQYQRVEILWDNATSQLTVTVEGVVVFNKVLVAQDGAQNITQGYFGFSASTGLATDIHSIKNAQIFLDAIPVQNIASSPGCVDDTGLTGLFNLRLFENDIAASGKFRYYKTLAAVTANNGADNIKTPNAYTGADGDIVYARVDNVDGCYSIATIKLSLIKLKAIAAAPPLSSCGGKQITLDGSLSTGQNLTYKWTTTDGKIISGGNQAQVNVIDSGTYVLTVSSGICQNSVEVVIDKKIISPIIDVAPVTDKISCKLPEITLDASKTQSGATITYKWTTTNGNIVSGDTTRTPIINKAGTYTFTAQDSNQSCVNSTTVVVEESIDIPIAKVIQKQPLKSCGAINIDLDGSGSSSGANITYRWSASPGGVIVSGQNTNTINVSAEGIYTLRVTNTTSTCFVDFEYDLQADIVKPIASIVEPEILSCLKGSILLDGSASDSGIDIKYNWTASLGGELPAVTNGNKLIVSKPGRYTLTVTNTTTTCTSSFFVDVKNDVSAIIVNVPQTVLLGCGNNPTILDGSQSSNNSNLVYKWTTVDGVLIGNTSKLTATAAKVGTYTLTISNPVLGCENSSNIKVVLDPSAPVVLPRYTLEECSGIQPGFATFNLRNKDADINKGATNVSVLYYLTGAEADSRASTTLPDKYTNAVQTSQMIFVRVENNDTNCYAITTLDLLVNPLPNPVVADPLRECDLDADGFAVFDLAKFSETIIDSDPEVKITYHETLNDAENNLFELPLIFSNIKINTQTIYARATNTRTSCNKIVAVQLMAQPAPQINEDVADIILCDDDTDGFRSFDLSQQDKLVAKKPTDVLVQYFTSEANAISGRSAIVDPVNFRNTIAQKQTIWARATNKTNNCFRYTKFSITLNPLPILVNIAPITLCDEGVNRKDGFTTFDLSETTKLLTNNQSGYQTNYFISDELAKAGDVSKAINTASFTNTVNPQVLYVRVKNTETDCLSYTTITLRVLPNPSPETPTPIELCDVNATGDGVEFFDLTEKQLAIENQEGGIALRYFLNQSDAEQGNTTSEIITPTAYQNTKRDTQTIYVRATNTITGCWSVVPLSLIVHQIPEAKDFVSLNVCSISGTTAADFDLLAHSKTILKNITKPEDYSVTYYLNQADAQAATKILPNVYRSEVKQQTIWVRVEHTETECYQIASFDLLIGEEVIITQPTATLAACGDVVDNMRQANFDLTSMATTVLNGQSPADFTINYYQALINNVLSNPISAPNNFVNTSYPQTIYVQVTRNVLPNCSAIAKFDLEINLKPTPVLPQNQLMCLNEQSVAINSLVLSSGLRNETHTFSWEYNGQPIALATENSYTATLPGDYKVIAINKDTGCSGSDSTTITGSAKPVFSIKYLTADFTGTGSILIESLDPTLYTYQIGNDERPDPLFQNLTPGTHVLTVRDIKGCHVIDKDVTIIDYPQFFTPNGDGANDEWKLIGLETNDKARVYIYDRNGKLLKEMKTSDKWNGTFNGSPLPSTDYWFMVQYENQGQMHQFKSNFTLKR